MYRFTSIKYIATTALVSALLTVVGLGSFWAVGKWIATALGAEIIQLFDGVLMALAVLIPGPMLLFAGIIAGLLTDLFLSMAGTTAFFSLMMIPATIIIRILMFVIIRIFMTNKWYSCLWAFGLALLPVLLLYPLYTYLVIDPLLAVPELIINCVQCGLSYLLGIGLYWQLNAIQVRSNNCLWNDEQFNNF